jgi:hypothetical protein
MADGVKPILLFASAAMLSVPLAARAQDGNARATAIAAHAPRAKAALAYIVEQAKRIQRAPIRTATRSIVENPAPTFMGALVRPEDRARVRDRLVEAHLLDPSVTADALFPALADPEKAPQAFLSAPGSILDRHHAHPGGLAEHTAFNLHAALDIAASYTARYGVTLDRDLVIAAPIWHDAMKPWCLQWNADGTLTEQTTIAGTASHHVFAIAEAMKRGLPPELVVAIAFAHDPPTEDARKAFLEAGAILAGMNPISPALAPIEAYVDNLSDHDYVLADAAAIKVTEALSRLIARPPTDAEARWRRHTIRARVPDLVLYDALRKGGDDAVQRELAHRHVSLSE